MSQSKKRAALLGNTESCTNASCCLDCGRVISGRLVQVCGSAPRQGCCPWCERDLENRRFPTAYAGSYLEAS